MAAARQIIGRIAVKVVPDTKEFRRELKDDLKRIEQDLKVQIKVSVDDASRREAEREIDRLKNKVDNIKCSINPEVNDLKKFEAQAKLAFLSRPRTVLLIPKVSKIAAAKAAAALAALSGARVLRDTLRGVKDYLKSLDKAVPLIGTIAFAVAGLSASLATGASNLFALSSSLASIGPAALLLPGLLAGIGVGVGTMIVAFKDFNKVFPDVKDKLSGLQKLISSNFWAKAKAPFRELIDEVFPLFQKGLGKTGTQLGGFFGDLAKSLRTHLAPALTQMFDDLAKSINVFSEHTDGIVKIIKVLGSVGSSQLPRLAQFFGEVADKFAKFLTAAQKSGELQEWIDTAITAIGDLGRVVSNLFGIFAGIGRAAQAAGGSVLSTLADTLERIHKIVDSFGFQDGLTKFLRAAHIAMDEFFDRAGPGFEDLMKAIGTLSQTLLPLVGRTLGDFFGAIFDALAQPEFMDGLMAMFEGIAAGMEALVPVMRPLGAALGALGTVIGAVAENLGHVFAAALIPLLEAFAQIAPALIPIIGTLGQALVDVFLAVTPTIEKMVPVIVDFITELGDVLADVAPDFVTFLTMIGRTLIDSFVDLLKGLQPLLPDIAAGLAAFGRVIAEMITIITPALVDLLVAFLTALVDAFKGIDMDTISKSLVMLAFALADMFAALAEMAPDLAQAFVDLLNAVIPLLPQLVELVIEVLPILPALLQAVIDILPALTDLLIALTPIINGVVLGLTAMVNVFGTPAVAGLTFCIVATIDSITSLLDLLADLKGWLWDIGFALDGFFADMGSGIWSELQTIDQTFKDFFRDSGTWLFEGGKSIVEGLAKGIAKGVTDFIPNAIGGIGSAITGGFDALMHINSPAKVMIAPGSSVTEGVAKGIGRGHSFIKRALTDLSTIIQSADLALPLALDQLSKARVTSTVDIAAGEATPIQKVFNYYAAPGSSLGSEEDLFKAAERARFEF